MIPVIYVTGWFYFMFSWYMLILTPLVSVNSWSFSTTGVFSSVPFPEYEITRLMNQQFCCMCYEVLTLDSLIYFWILFFMSVEWDGQSMWRVWWRGEVQIEFWGGNLRGRDNMVRPTCRWGSIIIMGLIFVWRSWTGMIWLRMGTSGDSLWTM